MNISEINIQGQLDSPFLIASSPGEAGRAINRITKLEESEKWMTKLTSKINITNKEVEIFKRDLGEKEEQLKEYDILPIMEVRITKLSEVYDNWVTEKGKEKRLEEFIEQLTAVDGEIVEIQRRLEIEKKVIQAEQIQQSLIQIEKEQELIDAFLDVEMKLSETLEFLNVQEKIEVVEKLSSTFQEQKEKERRLTVFLEDLESCSEDIKERENFLCVENSIEQLFRKKEEIENITVQRGTLSWSIERIEEIENKLSLSLMEYERLEDNYRKELRQMKICPYCFSILSQERIEEIMGVCKI